MKDRKLSNALGSREYGVFLGGVHTRESTHFIDKYFIDKKEDKIDEQITKIYSYTSLFHPYGGIFSNCNCIGVL